MNSLADIARFVPCKQRKPSLSYQGKSIPLFGSECKIKLSAREQRQVISRYNYCHSMASIDRLFNAIFNVK